MFENVDTHTCTHTHSMSDVSCVPRLRVISCIIPIVLYRTTLLPMFVWTLYYKIPDVNPFIFKISHFFPSNQYVFFLLGHLVPIANTNIYDNGYPHNGRADKNPYPHDRRADKDSYPHDSNNQCIILRLQLSFVMINVQLMLV